MPHHYFPSQLLPRAARRTPDGAHKAKLGIHQNVANILLGNLINYDAGAALMNIKKNVLLYRLEKWYTKKLDEWIKKYNKLNPQDQRYRALESLKCENKTFHL